eukprot:3282970-Rhodomonas_salina.1
MLLIFWRGGHTLPLQLARPPHCCLPPPHHRTSNNFRFTLDSCPNSPTRVGAAPEEWGDHALDSAAAA